MRALIHLVCLIAVLIAPFAMQSRLAEQFGESLCELVELSTLEGPPLLSFDSVLTTQNSDLPAPIDFLSWDLLRVLPTKTLSDQTPPAGEYESWGAWPVGNRSDQQSRLQVYRC